MKSDQLVQEQIRGTLKGKDTIVHVLGDFKFKDWPERLNVAKISATVFPSNRLYDLTNQETLYSSTY